MGSTRLRGRRPSGDGADGRARRRALAPARATKRLVPRGPSPLTQYEDLLGWAEERLHRVGRLPALPEHEEGTITYSLDDDMCDEETP
eukprot:4606630-Lingulodinium_polyedra.AAC.1